MKEGEWDIMEEKYACEIVKGGEDWDKREIGN